MAKIVLIAVLVALVLWLYFVVMASIQAYREYRQYNGRLKSLGLGILTGVLNVMTDRLI